MNGSDSLPAGVSTIQALPGLGFAPAATPMPGYRFRCGGLNLSAVEGMSHRSFRMSVQFWGFVADGRTVSEIGFELPTMLDSLDELKALLAHYLDSAAEGVDWRRAEPTWLPEGRALAYLLPWARTQAEYERRPRCRLRRRWARLVLDSLAEHLSALEDNVPVIFRFDGKVLRIECGDRVVASAAEGDSWARRCVVKAGDMRQLPRRIMRDPVEVSCYSEHLHLGNWSYPSTWEGDGPAGEE